MLVFVVLTVFIAGLMVGRTPNTWQEDRGAGDEAGHAHVLVFPGILSLAGWAAVARTVCLAGQRGRTGFPRFSTRSPRADNGLIRGLNANTDSGTSRLGADMLLDF